MGTKVNIRCRTSGSYVHARVVLWNGTTDKTFTRYLAHRESGIRQESLFLTIFAQTIFNLLVVMPSISDGVMGIQREFILLKHSGKFARVLNARPVLYNPSCHLFGTDSGFRIQDSGFRIQDTKTSFVTARGIPKPGCIERQEL
jgi:hypothetical protein